MNSPALALAAVVLLHASAPAATNDVWGVKSNDTTGVPSVLFRFADDLSDPSITVIASAKRGVTEIDLDALALDAGGLLYGFEILGSSSSRLVAVDTVTAAVTTIGPVLAREIRGATFDQSGRLIVLDTASDQILEIDAGTGLEVGAGVPVTLGGVAFDLCCSGTDLAQRSDGCLVLVDFLGTFSVDATSGNMTLLHEDLDTATNQGLPIFNIGLAIPTASPNPLTMITFEADGDDDIFAYDPSNGFARTIPYPNILSSFNAGRGDLACAPPGSLGSSTYCTAGSSSSGCNATLSSSGVASATAVSGFTLTASAVEGSKDGLFFFGTNGRQANSWGNGTSFQCVVPPVMRAGLLSGSGSVGLCDGTFSQDLNARWCATCPRPSQNPGPGVIVQAQLWFRDPFNTSNQTTSLSGAIEFCVGP